MKNVIENGGPFIGFEQLLARCTIHEAELGDRVLPLLTWPLRSSGAGVRRLPEKRYQIAPDFRLSARRSPGRMVVPCNREGNAADGRKDQQDGIFFDRNRLNAYSFTPLGQYPVRALQTTFRILIGTEAPPGMVH